MAKKKDDKQDSGTITVNKEEFKQTRDTFLSSFVVLQDAIRDLTSNYIKHTNTVLGDSGSNIDSVLKDLGEVAGNAAAAAGRSISPAKSEPEKKKERKKRIHDPNAPKRPLTPFFLYMQTARPIITQDLGPEAAKGAVSEEGTRRWGTMGKSDRDSWTRAYQDNLKLYHAKMHSYKAGNLAAKKMTDDEALVYWDDNLAGAGDHAADAQLVNEALANDLDADLDVDAEGSGDADIDADGEADTEDEIAVPTVVKSPTPPPKTPKDKSSRKKATKTETPIIPPAPTPTVAASQAPEPEKKRKRKTKAEIDREKASAEAVVDSIEGEELLVQTPAAPKSSKPKKKKAKNDA